MNEELLKRIKFFGIENQKRKFSEESEELRDAIVEYEFSKKNYKNLKLRKLKEHIAEEIVDCLALLKQFRLYYEISDEEIKNIMKIKNKRTNERMKNGYYNKN